MTRSRNSRHRKVTVSLPEDLARFADELARRGGGSRSAVVRDALRILRRTQRERLLEEGYRFYAEIDVELAEEGMEATNEVWPDE